MCMNLTVLQTVEPDLIATEVLAFPSKSSRNKNDSVAIKSGSTV